MTTIKKYNSIQDIKNSNRSNGKHFFEVAALRFFNSKIGNKVYRGSYFITSEQFDENTPRLYTIRLAMNGGRIETLPKFQAFETKKETIEYIQSLPEYLPEAMQYLNDCFKADKNQEFIDTALLEPVNSRTGDYDPTTFCGACSWLCDHSKSIDDSVLSRVAAEYQKQLEEHINEL